MKQQHHPHDIRTYSLGANRDGEDEFISLNDGEYIDACNMRSIPMDGDNLASKKISGEELLYPAIDNACTDGNNQPITGNYVCIGVQEINGHIIEFWADDDAVLDSIIRIDGKIVCKSPDFPITAANPLQIHKNESCIGGEIYITDYAVPPMIFNIEDLLQNSGLNGGECTTKYFDDFNINEHLLILTQALDHPVFIQLTASSSGIDTVLGAGGLPVGYYTYSFRYVTEDGDRTAFSAPTPQIPVVVRVSDQCAPTYPNSQTHSKAADITSPSTLGVHFKLRVNNTANYDFIEIKRVSWNLEDPKGTPPVPEIIGKIDIAENALEVLNILDLGAEAEEVLSQDQATEVLAAIERAKAIRYFNQRLYLMNIAYGSRDIDETTNIIGGASAMFPTIENIGKDGHTDPWKHTYHKAYLHGEKYGFGMFVWDEQGERSYVKKIDGFENYQFPNRREPISSLTEDTSYRGVVRAATTDGTVDNTHEVFDLKDAVAKSRVCDFHNILDADAVLCDTAAGKLVPQIELDEYGCSADDAPTCTTLSTVKKVKSADLGHRPFTPVSQDDTNCNSADYRVNLKVSNQAVGSTEYNPKGFAPNHYAQGIGMQGVSSFPSWAKAFTVVRTEPAGKVVGQGLGFYKLNSADTGLKDNTSKDVDRMWMFSPDLDSSIGIDPLVVDDIINNPDNYLVQAVSPLGFFSEIYAFDNSEGLNLSDNAVDFITYANIIRDKQGSAAEINPDENPSMGIDGGDGFRYTAFGKWRSSSFISGQPYPSGGQGNKTFEIDTNGFSVVTEGRGEYFEIRLKSSIYGRSTTGGKVRGDQTEVQEWHEPLYIINIIKKEADVPDTNITNYIYTGHYQKIDSVVGRGDGTVNQTFELVDERWEDCIDDVSGLTNNTYDSLFRFTFIRDVQGDERRWVNVTNLSAGLTTAILNDLQSNGSATITDSSGTYTVYGVYKHTETFINTAPKYELVFEHFNTTYNKDFFVPNSEELVIVRYDSRIPLRVFGGDVTVGEAIWSVQDNRYSKDADPADPLSENLFRINVAFPYLKYVLNPRIFIANKTTGVNKVQDNVTMKFDNADGSFLPAKIRQMCNMFTCESRTNLNFAYNIETPKESNLQAFPMVNYIMRPYNFKSDSFSSQDLNQIYVVDNNMFDNYGDDYGHEYLNWNFGGFRFLPQVNIDYCKEDDSLGGIASVPEVGFEEQNLFCTRVIWSEKRPPNIQDTPTVRTFPSANIRDISDDTGEIKFAWDEISGKGNNLYAFTDSGICLLLVDKRVIHEINANELATVGSDIGGILNELWINKDIGMADEMWRSAAEYSNQLFWANYNSAYKFANTQLVDIGRKKYHRKIYNDFLKDFGSGYSDHVTGVYDILHNEYWINFKKIGSLGNGGSDVPSTTHVLGGVLNVVDEQYDTAKNDNDTIVGVVQGEGLRINLCVNPPLFVNIGGVNNNLLSINGFSICNECTLSGQSFVLRYWDGQAYQEIATVNQGECYCVSQSGMVGDLPTWQALPCSPFNNGNPNTATEQFDCPTQVYSEANEYWQGGYDYAFDRYLSFDNKIYGMRGLETYELNKGTQINGEPIEAFVISASALPQPVDKEFVRIRVNSNNKPTSIEFFDNLQQCLDEDVQAELNESVLRDYYGFEQYIPRRTSPPNNRMQGRLLVFKIKHNLEEDFKIMSTDIQYKQLK